MRVRFNTNVAILLTVLGAVGGFIGIWEIRQGEFDATSIAGLIPLVVGIAFLVRPYFLVERGQVTVPALFGPGRRLYAVARMEVDGGRLYVIGADGNRKKLPVARWLAHPADWAAVVDGVR